MRVRCLVLAVVPLVLSACANRVPAAPGWPALSLAPCHLDRLAEEVLCGAHEVFEDRAARRGRTLRIQLAVLPALRRTAQPDPLFILAGGPGQGARGFAPAAARFFRTIRRTREIVLVDLRGTGASAPLACPGEDDLLALSAGLLLDAAAVARCRAGLQGDPRHYTHTDALADLDEIRQRLGYAQINLWGGSWGTRAALLYAMTHPHAVRSVVLDGAVPLSLAFPRTVAASAHQAFERLWRACAAEPSCAAAHANAPQDFAALLARLEAGGDGSRVTAVPMRHPRTGAPTTAAVSRDMMAEIVRVALYTPGDAARVFQMIRHAAAGDFAPMVAQAFRSASATTDDMALGQTLSVLCSEDLPLVERADFARDAAGTFLQSSYADLWRRRCAGWPRGPGLTVAADATSSVPALILSGEHDPVTPPETGEAMGRHFVNHLHVVVPGAAHNTSFSGCVPDLIAAFVNAASAGGLDAGCAARLAWPPAVVSDAGTTP